MNSNDIKIKTVNKQQYHPTTNTRKGEIKSISTKLNMNVCKMSYEFSIETKTKFNEKNNSSIVL